MRYTEEQAILPPALRDAMGHSNDPECLTCKAVAEYLESIVEGLDEALPDQFSNDDLTETVYDEEGEWTPAVRGYEGEIVRSVQTALRALIGGAS